MLSNEPTRAVRHSPHPAAVPTLSTDAVRAAFVVEDLFRTGEIVFTFTDLDRLALAGVVCDGEAAVRLPDDPRTGRATFLERRELGAINLGGPGVVTVDGTRHDVGALDTIYVGMGAREVTFASNAPDGHTANPQAGMLRAGTPRDAARFYLVSCPAHHAHPTAVTKKSAITPRDLGSQATANRRQIFQAIHEAGVKSCQLVMGFTQLAEGSVWNTMPPHTHLRRSEIYLYDGLPAGAIVAHFLGEPHATRHVFVTNGQAVMSPPWSIHAGCGTAAYRFVWAMAGENQRFDDMDAAPAETLR